MAQRRGRERETDKNCSFTGEPWPVVTRRGSSTSRWAASPLHDAGLGGVPQSSQIEQRSPFASFVPVHDEQIPGCSDAGATTIWLFSLVAQRPGVGRCACHEWGRGGDEAGLCLAKLYIGRSPAT